LSSEFSRGDRFANALLVIPVAAARLLTDRLGVMMLLACAFSIARRNRRRVCVVLLRCFLRSGHCFGLCAPVLCDVAFFPKDGLLTLWLIHGNIVKINLLKK